MFLGSISPWYVVLDSAKNAYMVGDTGPTSFPTTAGAFQMTAANSAFATNLKATGTALIYSTCLGAMPQLVKLMARRWMPTMLSMSAAIPLAVV